MVHDIFGKDERYVGYHVGGCEVEITPERVSDYIDATGDRNPWYLGDSPAGCQLAPAFLLYSEAARFREGRRFKWLLPNVFRTLLARQEWEIFLPLKVGESARTHAFIIDRYVKREREYVVLELLCFNSDGYLASRTRLHQSFVTESAPGGNPRRREPERNSAIAHSEQRDGEPIEGPTRTITEQMSFLTSGREHDVHSNPEISRKVGFTNLHVQGSLAVNLIGELMTRRFGLGFYYGGRADVKLVNMLRVGEDVTPRGCIFERYSEGKRMRAAVDVWCEKADGTRIAVGTASALEL